MYYVCIDDAYIMTDANSVIHLSNGQDAKLAKWLEKQEQMSMERTLNWREWEVVGRDPMRR